MTNDHDDNLVSPCDGCPTCSERDQDKLVWIDDDTVRCSMCGTQYQPLKGEHDDDGQS